jgi:hypothetical protein
MDEASVQRQLKRLDGRLVLQKHARDGVEGGWVYKVVCIVSDTLAPIIYTWMDDYGNPLPLSSGLVDAVQSLLLGSRNKPEDEDAWNARVMAERNRDIEREKQAMMDDHRPYVDRGRKSVSFAKAGKPAYWKRGGKVPRSGKDLTRG